MVKTLTEDFENFVSEISLDKHLVDDLIAKHNSLGEMIKINPPEGYKISETRLSGSYAKRIVLNETDYKKKPDVDLVLILETDKEDVEEINCDFLTYLIEKKLWLFILESVHKMEQED